MAKNRNEGGFLNKLAVTAGHVAGVVENTAESIIKPGAEKSEPRNEDIDFEKSDFHYRGVLIGGACFLGGTWLSIGLLFFYFTYLKQYRAEVSPPPLPIALHGNPLPPEPRLQGSPQQDLKTYRAGKVWELNHYYWIDKSKGQVALPIEQSIQMLAQRGIPPQKTPPNATLTPPESGTRLTGFEDKVKPEPR